MSKKQPKKTPIMILDERLQKLNKKRLAAYQAGASHDIISQFDRMIAETEVDLYTETELQRERNKKDNNDGEQWIV